MKTTVTVIVKTTEIASVCAASLHKNRSIVLVVHPDYLFS